MNLEAARLFCLVVESESVTEAARRLHISQPAASQRLRSLEQELGHRLLHRGPGRVRPNQAGMQAYKLFRDVVRQLDSLKRQLDRSHEVLTGTIRVATVFSVGLHVLPAVVRQFVQNYKSCRVDLEFYIVKEIYSLVAEGRFDLGLVPYPISNQRFAVIPVFDDDLVLIIPPNHPLAGVGSISPTQLSGLRLITWPEGALARRYADRLLAKHGAEMNVVLELENVETIKAAVKAELGSALVPNCAVADELTAGVFGRVRIEGDGFIFRVGAVYRKDLPLSAAAQKFVSTLVDATRPEGHP